MLQEEEGSFCYLEARQDRFPHQLKPWAHIVQHLPIPIIELAITAFQFASTLLIADVKLPQRKLYWKGSECACAETKIYVPGNKCQEKVKPEKKSVLGGTGVQGKQAFGGNREEENIWELV